MATFTGTTGSDTASSPAGVIEGFTGGSVAELQDAIGDNFIGGDGADTVLAGSGDDVIDGDLGNDALSGANGNDTVSGGDGNDGIEGGVGDDTLIGGGGDDVFAYAAAAEIGEDVIDGGAGVDRLRIDFTGIADFTTATFSSVAGFAIDYLALNGDGHDVRFNAAQIGATGLSDTLKIEGDTGVDSVTFNNASNLDASKFQFVNWDPLIDRIVLNGTDAADTFIGSNASANIFSGGLGDDTFTGTTRNDTFIYRSNAEIGADRIILLNSGPNDVDELRVEFSGIADFTNLTFNHSINALHRVTLVGAGHDVIFEHARNRGFADNLVISGDASGVDTVTFNTDSADFRKYQFENWNEGVDQFIINISSAGASINDHYGSTRGDSITGGAGADRIFGELGDDVISGGQGDDAIVGGMGRDVLDGGDGHDTASFHQGEGPVTVFLGEDNWVANSIGDTISNFESVIGSGFGDTLVGDGGANTFHGGFGDDFIFSNGFGPGGTMNPSLGDTILGHQGNDAIFGGDGADTLYGGVFSLGADTGNDSILGGGGDDQLIGDAGDDLLFGGSFATDGSRMSGSGDDTIDGGFGRDALYGFDGVDTLTGGSGDDYVEGGDGKDTINGGDGADYLLGQADSDTINGGRGFDYLYGGAGADFFIFRRADSADWILDFRAAEGDKLRFEGFGYASFADVPLVDLSTPGNPAVQLTYSGSEGVDQLTIFGVTLAELNATNVLVA